MKHPPDPRISLEAVQQLRTQHGFRAETLVPDIAFIGLIDDCIDAGQTAIQLLESPQPYRAYSMLRVAFEATQRLLLLATNPDYMCLGTRAWLYYNKKDAAIRGGAKDKIGQVGEKLIDTWANYYPPARQLVLEQLDILNKTKGPDNFLGRNVAEATTESYSILARENSASVPSNSAEVNREFYRSLSRETHACMRLEPSEVRVDSDGFVEVRERPRDPAEVARVVTAGLDVIFTETIAAIKYRLLQRRRANTARLENSLHEVRPKLPTGYIADLGISLAQQGLGNTEQVFPDIPIQHISELQDGTLSSTLTTGLGSETQVVTFDFKGHARQAILAIISEDFPEAIPSAEQTTSLRIDLPSPITIMVKAELGQEQHTGTESFIPFIVTQVARANLRT